MKSDLTTSLAFLLVLVVTVSCQSQPYNLSLCADIEIDQLHYYINEAEDNSDLHLEKDQIHYTYNLCKQV